MKINLTHEEAFAKLNFCHLVDGGDPEDPDYYAFTLDWIDVFGLEVEGESTSELAKVKLHKLEIDENGRIAKCEIEVPEFALAHVKKTLEDADNA